MPENESSVDELDLGKELESKIKEFEVKYSTTLDFRKLDIFFYFYRNQMLASFC